ncbi:MAG TPA: hypothetical protein DDZ92_03905 [Halomonas sp.]|nr:hypothetical protein [Halomonas sp.]|tara:strand:+ start:5786 stop:6037 length:252 start_codon:yes stop_codon:yes gene_type:complete
MWRLLSKNPIPTFPPSATVITPDDDARFVNPMAVEAISDGDIEVISFGKDETITISGVVQGYRVPFLVRAVLLGTTADVIGLY